MCTIKQVFVIMSSLVRISRSIASRFEQTTQFYCNVFHQSRRITASVIALHLLSFVTPLVVSVVNNVISRCPIKGL